jgi:Peptidase A4 family
MKLNKVIAIPALALAAGISLAACGQVTVNGAALSTGKAMPAAVSGPMIPARSAGNYGSAAANDTLATYNWSGYAAHTSRYNSVSATWTEPGVSCPSTQVQYSSFWVGLDGYKSRSVEQIGTDSACNGRTPVYYIWYEMYPAYPVYFTNHVYPGDHFTASVTVRDGAYYTLKIADSNRGWSHTVYITHRGLADSSAEVIAEAPSAASGILPLANFGNVYFSSAEVNGHSMGSVPHANVVMENNSSRFKDYVSGLTDNGRKFHVTWAHSS